MKIVGSYPIEAKTSREAKEQAGAFFKDNILWKIENQVGSVDEFFIMDTCIYSDLTGSGSGLRDYDVFFQATLSSIRVEEDTEDFYYLEELFATSLSVPD